ncbi:MAG: pyridoxal 5'-phosphate synthase glutaminase subunit PdxT [Spirochaetales bacterium]|nr:pyridoxal 5'-phosphate synthase glutaminase subunit PdxT [Spirochaetales bacterium]
MIGVLALQGDYEKHALMLELLGAGTLQVREPADLARVDALVIPGGESTTIGKLMAAYELLEPMRNRIAGGMPVFGTCAGLILLAAQTKENHQHRLGVLDISVQRNAYGRQVDSFEADIHIPAIGEKPFRAVFIRAPMVTEMRDSVITLAEFENKPVLMQKENILAGSFHPELTEDTRVHAYFLKMVAERGR